MKNIFAQLQYFSFGLLISLAAITPAQADDIEVYINGGSVTPKIMMILDTSMSMATHVSGNESRLTHMKRAMKQYIEQAEDVQIGLMRMNQLSGAVIYPVSDLNKMVTENVKGFNRPISANKNNAYQLSDGEVKIEVLKMKLSHMPLKDSSYIGLRFTNIIVPRGRKISKAYVEIFRQGACGKKNGSCKTITFTIKGEKTANSTAFLTQNYNLSARERNSTSATATINIRDWSADKETYTLDGLAPVIQEIVNQSGWRSGNNLSLILNTAGITSDEHKKISIKTALGRYSPTLFIEFQDSLVRTISVRQQMIEALDNQKLTFHTPIVPTLYEAAKYLAGANIDSSLTGQLTSSRSALERVTKDKLHERIPHKLSYINGTETHQNICSNKNLNSKACVHQRLTNAGFSQPLQYKSPIVDTCSDDSANIVLLTDGEPNHKEDSNSTGHWWYNMIKEIKTVISPATCPSVDSANGYPKTCGVRLATKLHAGIKVRGVTDLQKVTLYTVGFNNDDTFLIELAKQGEETDEAEKRYSTANNSDELFKVFKSITGSVVGRNTTLTNSAASISSDNRLNNNSRLFYALFEPSDKDSWVGNLKHYTINDLGQVIDKNLNIAIDSATGMFKETAQSVWSAEVDGAEVGKGGAANRLPAYRNIYIDHVSNGANTTVNLSDSTKNSFSIEDFAVTTNHRKNALIDSMLTSQKMADPLHSMPIEVSYNVGTLIFFGDNQGYIHAINADTGVEQYAFMPKELLKNQHKISQNTISNKHIYGMDGELTFWKKGGKKYLYSGMRRGGSSYYALDITNFYQPVVKWEITPDSPGFSKLGQTWSKPIKAKINYNGSIQDVLIFGGGYDPQQDLVTKRTVDTKGGAVYVVNAETGAIIWSKTDMAYSVPSNVRVISTSGDNIATQFYVGDMGGQVWRFDIGTTDITSNKIAVLAIGDKQGNRRFYHAPDISLLKDGQTLAIAIGSGYRAHPNNDVINDEFYVLKQPLYTPATKIIERSNLYDATENFIGVGTTSQKLTATRTLQYKEGWYMSLKRKGEKVLGSSLTFKHSLWFTTYQPGQRIDACKRKKSTARIYRLNIADATPTYKDTVPSDLDGNKSCSQVSCDTDDRSTELKSAILPPEPSLLSIDNTNMISVGTENYPISKRKARNMYWRTEK